jgi:hypothetical protein
MGSKVAAALHMLLRIAAGSCTAAMNCHVYQSGCRQGPVKGFDWVDMALTQLLLLLASVPVHDTCAQQADLSHMWWHLMPPACFLTHLEGHPVSSQAGWMRSRGEQLTPAQAHRVAHTAIRKVPQLPLLLCICCSMRCICCSSHTGNSRLIQPPIT